MQSPLFGVIPISQEVSSESYVELKSVPGANESSSNKIPSCSSQRPSSLAEHIIPFETTPLISLFSIKKLSTICDFGNATGTIAPTSKFHAPQTIS